MGTKRSHSEDAPATNTGAASHASKKARFFTPKNLPDGPWRRKLLKDKEAEIQQKKAQRAYAKAKAQLQREKDQLNRERREQQQTAAAARSALQVYGDPASSLGQKVDGGDGLGGKEDEMQDRHVRGGGGGEGGEEDIVQPGGIHPERHARLLNHDNDDTNEGTGGGGGGGGGLGHGRGPPPRSSSGLHSKEARRAARRKREAEERAAERARRAEDKARRLAERERARRAMGKIRRERESLSHGGGKGISGRQKLSKESGLLLDKVRRLVSG